MASESRAIQKDLILDPIDCNHFGTRGSARRRAVRQLGGGNENGGEAST